MRVELYITPYGQTTAVRADLDDSGDAISLNYNIVDINTPDKRSSSYSKSITLPGTPVNNVLFNHIFEIDSNCNFNPNKKAAAILYVDTLQQFAGYIQLTKISTTRDNTIVYTANLMGQLGDLFYTINQGVTNALDQTNPAYLQNLDLSGLAHARNTTNIIYSWTNGENIGYVYPLLDNGYLEGYGGNPPALLGYYYMNAKNMLPSIYVKTIVDAIFAQAGFTYTSDFFNTPFFKSLIIPCVSWQRRAVAISGTFTITPYNINGSNLATTQVQIFSGYDSSIKTYTVYNTGEGYITWSGVGNNTNTDDNGNYYYTTGDNILFQVQNNNTYDVTIAAGATMTLQYDATDGLGLDYSGTITTNNDVTIAAGQTVILFDYMDGGSTVTASTANWLTPPAPWPFFDTVTGGGGYCGFAPTSLSYNLTPNIKQADFLTWLTKMFNLYFQPDRYNPHLLYIEPRDMTCASPTPSILQTSGSVAPNGLSSFYGGTSYYTPITVDWTSKVDKSQPIEQQPMLELQGKIYVFAYQTDTDFWNNFYENGGSESVYGEQARTAPGYLEPYGTYRYLLDNDFLTSEYSIGPGFSPTPLVQYENPEILSSIIAAAPTLVSNPPNNVTGNMRILIYGGLISTGTQSTNNSASPWSLTTDMNPTPPGTSNPYYTYPYAGHLDNPLNPTVDLNYFTPYQVYFPAPASYNSSMGLFSIYWSTYTVEVTNKGSQLVTMYMRLTAADIATFDFRNAYYIDGHNYKLYSIEDYDPTTDGLTKCTFLKSIEGLTYVPNNRIVHVNLKYPVVMHGPQLGTVSGLPGGTALPRGGIISAPGGVHITIGDVTPSLQKTKTTQNGLYGGTAFTTPKPFTQAVTGTEIATANVLGSRPIIT